MTRYFFLANNYNEFRQKCIESGLNPNSHDVLYIDDLQKATSVRITSEDKLYVTRRFWQRKGAVEIANKVRQAGGKL